MVQQPDLQKRAETRGCGRNLEGKYLFQASMLRKARLREAPVTGQGARS